MIPRKIDRRRFGQSATDFPLRLPGGDTVAEERRLSADRRANSFISQQALFQEVAWEYIEPLLETCPRRQLAPGEILLSPERENEHLYLLCAGRLRVHLDRPDAEGGFAIEAGEFTGDMSVIDGKRPSAFVVAEEPCEIIALHRDFFWERVTVNPNVARNILGMFVERMRQGNQAALAALEEKLRFQHLQRELDSARHIQLSMLPRPPLLADHPQLDAFAIMHAARDIGGDFFDALPLDDRRVYLAVGDVSGKGMPAALFMMRTITLLRDKVLRGLPLEELAVAVNDALSENNDSNMFSTVCIVMFDPRDGQLEYVSGGHNPLLLGSDDGGYRFLDNPRGILMGVMAGMPYEARRLRMQPGETLVLYTDGVTEAEDPEKAMFGDERLRRLLGTFPASDTAGLVQGLREAVAAHAASAPQSDDITLLALHYRGPDGVSNPR